MRKLRLPIFIAWALVSLSARAESPWVGQNIEKYSGDMTSIALLTQVPTNSKKFLGESIRQYFQSQKNETTIITESGIHVTVSFWNDKNRKAFEEKLLRGVIINLTGCFDRGQLIREHAVRCNNFTHVALYDGIEPASIQETTLEDLVQK